MPEYIGTATFTATKQEINDFIKTIDNRLMNPMRHSVTIKPNIKKVETTAEAVIMARQLKKGVFHGI